MQKSKKTPRVVVVTRPSQYDELMARHSTRQQTEFFLKSRGQDLQHIDRRHRLWVEANEIVSQAVPGAWRRSRVTRADLSRFVFEPDDIVVAIGQDGLVANVAKYLAGQPVVGMSSSLGSSNAAEALRSELGILRSGVLSQCGNRY